MSLLLWSVSHQNKYRYGEKKCSFFDLFFLNWVIKSPRHMQCSVLQPISVGFFFVLIHKFTRSLYKYDFQVVSNHLSKWTTRMSFFIFAGISEHEFSNNQFLGTN